MRAENKKSVHRLPSLNAIRAFEAVGRMLSYTSAAKELNVTISAISHQIKALEDFFGFPLVHMIDSHMSLTAPGERYFRQISRGITQLSIATQSLLRAQGERVLRISVGPTITTWWLVPRIERFQAAFPDIVLSLSASFRPVDFALGEYDMAVRYYARDLMPDRYTNAISLGKNEVFPVCSPRLLEGPLPLAKPADLKHHLLIETINVEVPLEESVGTWAGWLGASGNAPMAGARQMFLQPRGVMLQAVAQGAGVGLGRTLMASEAMAAGQLVCPFGPALPLVGNYYVICPDASADDKDIVNFRDWLVAEAEASTKQVKIPRA